MSSAEMLGEHRKLHLAKLSHVGRQMYKCTQTTAMNTLPIIIEKALSMKSIMKSSQDSRVGKCCASLPSQPHQNYN